MRICRIFLKNNQWVDLPLADGQGTRDVVSAMKMEGCIITDYFAIREDAWSFIALIDNGQPAHVSESGQSGGRVVPLMTVPKSPPPAS